MEDLFVVVENARPWNEKLLIYALPFFLYFFIPPQLFVRSSADAAVKHKHYYQTLYLEKRSLIGPWFRTLFPCILSQSSVMVQVVFFLDIQLLIWSHAVHVSP